MKNATVSIPDEVYGPARIKAAERDTSISAIVREFLMKLGEADSDFERRKKLQAEVLSRIKKFRARDRLGRDEVQDRDALR